MTLSEFDRRCRGYLRRTAQRDRPLRLIATMLHNAHRGPKDPALLPEQLLPLYGDPLPEPPPPPLTEEEVEAEFARTKSLDADLN